MFLDEAASEKSGAGKPPALGGWVLCPASVNPNEQIRIVDVMQEVAQSALPLDHATIMFGCSFASPELVHNCATQLMFVCLFGGGVVNVNVLSGLNTHTHIYIYIYTH